MGQPSESAAKHCLFVLNLKSRALGTDSRSGQRMLTCYLRVNICHFGRERKKLWRNQGKSTEDMRKWGVLACSSPAGEGNQSGGSHTEMNKDKEKSQ